MSDEITSTTSSAAPAPRRRARGYRILTGAVCVASVTTFAVVGNSAARSDVAWPMASLSWSATDTIDAAALTGLAGVEVIGSGAITVSADDRVSAVTVTRTVTNSYVETAPLIYTTDGRLRIDAGCGSIDTGIPACQAGAAVTVPPSLTKGGVWIDAGGYAGSVSGTRGDVQFDNVASVEARRIQGALVAHGVNGPVTVEDVRGGLTIDNVPDVVAAGAVTATNIGGDIAITASDLVLTHATGSSAVLNLTGGAKLTDVANRISLVATGGDVDVEQPATDVSVTTDEGRITVTDPGGYVEAISGTGPIMITGSRGAVRAETNAPNAQDGSDVGSSYVLITTEADAPPATVSMDTKGGRQTIEAPTDKNSSRRIEVNTFGGDASYLVAPAAPESK